MLRVSVLSTCTREKARDHPRKLLRVDLEDTRRRMALEGALAPVALPASRLYTGLPQRRLQRGLRALRLARSSGGERRARVDLWFLSAGFGLVHEALPLVPYDCSFNGLDAAELAAWAEQLVVPDSMRIFLSGPAELRLVLLGDPYLRACALERDTPLAAPTLFVTSRRMASRLPLEPCAG